MIDKEKKIKKKFSIYWLFGKIGDILFIPILIISLFSSCFMLIQKRQQKPTAVFGYSFVNILSTSMQNSGLKKGDTVITVKTDEQKIELGDVIAYYEMRNDPLDTAEKLKVQRYEFPENIKTLNPQNKILYSENGITLNTYPKKNVEHRWDVEHAQKQKRRVIFHMVIGIYVDENGSVFYETKGTNSSIDKGYIRSDFVIGEYVDTPVFLRQLISFCATSIGMIILVCIPLSLLVLMQCFSLIKQIETISYEKQLISKKKKFTDKDVQANFNGNYMETHNKVYLYFITEKEERQSVLNFMWGELLQNISASKKEKELLTTLKVANTKLEESSLKYWEYWINETKGYTQKKIKAYYEQVCTQQIFNQQKNKTTKDANKDLSVETMQSKLIKRSLKRKQHTVNKN